jgi:hypothetical protein
MPALSATRPRMMPNPTPTFALEVSPLCAAAAVGVVTDEFVTEVANYNEVELGDVVCVIAAVET